MNEDTRESSFDALTKGLASGNVSRGKALRLMGAALLGGTLASIPGVAFAANPCPSPRIKCRGECCAPGVTSCVGTGKNKTCAPPPPHPNGTNALCICVFGDINYCRNGLTCPDYDTHYQECTQICGGYPRNAYCYQDQLCTAS